MSGDGLVLWITGLSGAGKSTLAKKAVLLFRERGDSVVFLDGDELREVLGATATTRENHGVEARLSLARRYSALGRVLSSQGHTVVIATISLFWEIHEWNRQNLSNYFEVFLKVPIEELRRRDSKGIYRKFDDGELENVAGLDLEVNEPRRSDWVVEFDPTRTADSIARELVARTREEGNP